MGAGGHRRPPRARRLAGSDGPYTVGDLAGDVLAVLGELGVDSAHLVGLSLGGAVSQHLAITRPERVRSLTLLCTAAKFGEAASWTERAAAVRADGTESIADAVVGRWFTAEARGPRHDLITRHLAMVTGTT